MITFFAGIGGVLTTLCVAMVKDGAAGPSAGCAALAVFCFVVAGAIEMASES